jgi:hypothetical protein
MFFTSNRIREPLIMLLQFYSEIIALGAPSDIESAGDVPKWQSKLADPDPVTSDGLT